MSVLGWYHSPSMSSGWVDVRTTGYLFKNTSTLQNWVGASDLSDLIRVSRTTNLELARLELCKIIGLDDLIICSSFLKLILSPDAKSTLESGWKHPPLAWLNDAAVYAIGTVLWAALYVSDGGGNGISL